MRPVAAAFALGELLALEWTDIDFKNCLLTVMRNDWRGAIGAPKSGRDRKISTMRAGIKRQEKKPGYA